MLITYRTQPNRPPHRISCRLLTERHANPAEADYEGVYRDGMWIFDLPDDEAWDGIRLILDAQVASEILPRAGLDASDLDENNVVLSAADIAVDDGRLQQTWFATGTDQDVWDVIVVGSGMGGGNVLGALSELSAAGESNLTVLGLEAGSLLFPTHVANLPQRSYAGDRSGDPSMWNTLPDFGSQPWPVPTGWKGREVFALGGRSLYWGGLSPRIDDSELKKWPDAVRMDLATPNRRNFYDRAEALLSVGTPRADDFERDVLASLAGLMPDRHNGLAPVAVQIEKRTGWELPRGVFSTADLLIAQRLSHASGGSYGQPYIHLAELVVAVEPVNGKWTVTSVDLRTGRQIVRTSRNVVLSAGTIETPRLIAASRLRGISGDVGRNLTEHMMAYLHFQVPLDSSFNRQRQSAKLLSIPGPGGTGGDFNLLIELGSDLNEGRSVPAGWSTDRTAVSRPGNIAGQLVFLGRSDLGPAGVITFDHHRTWPDLNLPSDRALPSLTFTAYRPAIDPAWQPLVQPILDLLGAVPLDGSGNTQLQAGDAGMVSHEVGTMRMDADPNGGVVDADLQLHNAPGLFVCDNSVFPTSPAANPSLTLTALAIRLAHHLCGR